MHGGQVALTLVFPDITVAYSGFNAVTPLIRFNLDA